MDKERLEKEVEKLLEDAGFELVDLKYGRHHAKSFVQFFVDKAGGGITLDECGELSDRIGSFIDMNGIIDGGYVLEVSSPGLDRVLRKEKDFVKYAGQKVRVRLKLPVDNSRVYYGVLQGFENGAVLLSDGLKFELGNVEEVRLNPDYEDVVGRNKQGE